MLLPERGGMSFARAYRVADPAIADAPPGSPIPFVLSTPGVKRDGLDLSGVGFRAERYKSNPVVLAFHRYDDWPIGRGTIEVVDGPGGESLIATAEFDIDDPAGAKADRKYRTGQMHAVSLGWDDVDSNGVPIRTSGKRIAYRDILEFSVVAVPADPDAVIATSRSWGPDEASQARSWLVDLSGIRDVSDEMTRDIARTIQSLDGCEGGACSAGLRNLARTLANEVGQDGQPEADDFAEGHAQERAADSAAPDDADEADLAEAQKRAVMAGMLAACWVDDPDEADDAARKALRASLVADYRRFRMAVPPFVPARVFATLSEGLRAALFPNGELDMTLNVRVGKKISGKRADRLKACADNVREVAKEIDAILKEDAAENERGCGCGSGQSHTPEPASDTTGGDGAGLQDALAELSARYPDLRFTVEETTPKARGISGVDLVEKSADDSSSYGYSTDAEISDEMLAKLAELVAAQLGEREAGGVFVATSKRPDSDPEYPVEEGAFVTVRLSDLPDDLKQAIKGLASGSGAAPVEDAPADEPVPDVPVDETAAADDAETRAADDVVDPLLARLKAVITA